MPNTTIKIDQVYKDKLAAMAKLHKRSQTKELEHVIDLAMEMGPKSWEDKIVKKGI